MGSSSWLQRVNMTNCCNQRRSFLEKYGGIDDSLLIAYWMMAGYLDPVESVEKGYEKGINILMELKRKGMLSETSSDPNNHCSHKEHCTVSDIGFGDLLELPQHAKPTLTDGVLRDEIGSLLLLDCWDLQKFISVLTSLKRFKYIACFCGWDDRFKALLENVDNPTLLVLRGNPTSETGYYFEKRASVTVLEIPCGSNLIVNIAELTQLRCLNLSGTVELNLPEDLFSNLKQLRWFILRKCRL